MFAIKMFSQLHFIALIRAFLAFIGFERTYLIHAHCSFAQNQTGAITFIFVCRPWFTIHHIKAVHGDVANLFGNPELAHSVTIVSMMRIGGE